MDEGNTMNDLDQKINRVFAGSVVRKDLVKTVKGNAIVPSYVLEYLLGQYCATDDEATIQTGIESVRRILADHYVHRNESELVRSTIRERGRHKVIDKISVTLNDKDDVYEASFANLGISRVLVDSSTVKQHPKLLVSGVWCLADVEYDHPLDSKQIPWILGSLKPIQLSNFDVEEYLAARAEFSTEEWVDLLVQSIGFNPELFNRRAKLTQLVRLIPYCERNYNLVELGPKGTGKSHIYSEFSPHGMLISGGEITVPKLFVNNANGRLGLVGYWDAVAFDEFAGKTKKTDKALVDIMKNYMANKTFSRGVETLGAEASMVFVGNTQHTVPHMLKHADLFDELPPSYHDAAFLDRLHHYIPGWEVDIIRGEMFSSGYGFVVDYIAEILKSQRVYDYSDRYKEHFVLSSDISTRDRDGIHKTFSGLMKILYPHGQATAEEIEEILQLAIEGRKRVKDQILRIDKTMSTVRFGYETPEGEWREVATAEELLYPTIYYRGGEDRVPEKGTALPGTETGSSTRGENDQAASAQPAAADGPATTELGKMLTFQNGQTGASYERIFGPYLDGATSVVIEDPYIRASHQMRNLIDFVATWAKRIQPGDEVSLAVKTVQDSDPGFAQKQLGDLLQIKGSVEAAGIKMDVQLVEAADLHDRWVRINTGWDISLGRGLDIFEKPEKSFELGQSVQEFRKVRSFNVIYQRTSVPESTS
ncbi:BREX system Lon protease-like protein BrxL [Arthrobacter ipis]|uniref:BREX system Lon protease-like protein BrxL n=1 Tax=Arthrobacter ipis TaxID=2716202 RepID=UPI001FED000A|nr:BREX system Lon protease-like protein BrxL [Arthrobacter ipis]